MAVPVLGVICVARLVVFMAGGRQSAVTPGQGLQVRGVVLRGCRFGSALHDGLVLAVAAVGCGEKDEKMKKTSRENKTSSLVGTFFREPFETGSSVSGASYLFSCSFWEAHRGSCDLACVSLRLHPSAILSAASDPQTLQKQNMLNFTT